MFAIPFTTLLFGLIQLRGALAASQYTALHEYNYDLYGIAPAPTPGPKLLELKNRQPGELQKRQSGSGSGGGAFTKTCGYYDGVKTDDFNCDDPDGGNYACAYNNDANYFGCCSVSAGAFVLSACPNVNNPYTSCYPYSSASICTGACYYQNRVCDATYPFCGINLLTTGAATYTAWYCNSVQNDATYHILAQYTTDAYPTYSTTAVSSTTTPRSTSSTSRSTSPSSSTTSSFSSPSNNNQSPSTTTGTAGQSTQTSASPSPTGKGGSNTGAIAGGVVGGVVGLAAIIAGIVYFLHRKKAAERREARLEISQVQ